MAYLVLSIHPSLDTSLLYQRCNLVFEVINRPSERTSHAFEVDRGEWLEVEDERELTDTADQVHDVWRKHDVNVVACLDISQ